MGSGLRFNTEKEVFDTLKEEVVYDPTSPTYLKWLSCKKGRRKDLICGCIKKKGRNKYAMIGFNYKDYYVHRFIFYLKNGFLPEVIDHIDGCGLNNNPDNLRPSCPKTNPMNLVNLRSNNSTGFRGVCYDEKRNKWKGYVTLEGKQVMKRFDTIEKANEFVLNKRKELFGDFCDS